LVDWLLKVTLTWADVHPPEVASQPEGSKVTLKPSTGATGMVLLLAWL
jgi:hypothetical protein